MHVIGTAGHVDHGKSTLVERLTGIDPDRFEEEKRRGLTIDLGFAWLRLPSGREIGIVDVPGHERFVKNMLAGAGGVNVCLFVVDASEGWKPQSAEHLAIVDILGVSDGVVALTKADLVDADGLELARLEVEERIAASSLAGARVVPVSAVTGMGLDELVAELDRVLQAAPGAPDLGAPRLWIDRVFTISGAGTVVTGTLTGGRLRVGQEVEVTGVEAARRGEGARAARVRAIQTHKRQVESVGPGNRVALNLAGVERARLERGDAVVAPGWSRTTGRIDVEVRVLGVEVSGIDHELTHKGAHLLHVGSAETPVRVKLLGRDELGPGESGVAQLYLRDPLPLRRGDRFVLRDVGRQRTFGGGVVLDPGAPPARRTDPGRARLLEELRDADADRALRLLLDASGELNESEALFRSGAPQVPEGVARLGATLVSKARLEELKETLRHALDSHHTVYPLEQGMAREAARAAVDLDSARFEALVALTPEVVEEGATVRLASHRVALGPEQERARAALLERVDAGGFAPPPAKELDADPALVRSLVERGDLVRIGDFYLTPQRAFSARTTVRRAIEERGPLTVAEIRDLLGTTRKYAVPLCEWLDDTGATRRQGDLRSLGPNP